MDNVNPDNIGQTGNSEQDQLYRLAREYLAAIKSGSPEVDQLRESLIKHSYNYAQLVAERARDEARKMRQHIDEGKEYPEGINALRRNAYNLGFTIFLRALVATEGDPSKDAALNKAKKDALAIITDTDTETRLVGSDTILPFADGTIDGITTAEMFILKDAERLKQKHTKKFIAAAKKARQDLENGLITQEQADAIVHIEKFKNSNGIESELITGGPEYPIPRALADLWKRQEKLINAFIKEVAEAMGIDWAPPAQTTIKRKTKTDPAQLSIWDGWDSMGYYPMIQSPGYNALIKLLGATATRTDHYLGKRFIDRGNITLSITGLPDSVKRLPTSAAKLLDLLQIKATQGGLGADRSVSLSLREYMDARGLRDKKEARKTVRRDLELLQRVDVKYKDQKTGWLNVSLSGGTRGLINGIIGFKFNEDWLKLFPINNQIMPFPKGLFATDDNRTPHSYFFGRVIFEHRRMNDGKPNECIISVRTLVKASPTFPTYESLGEARQVDKRIIEPFNRDMQAAADATGGKFYWEYAGLFTDKEPDKYDDFISAKIHITWNQYPDTDTIKKGRAKYKKMADKGKLIGKKGGVAGR